MADRPTVMRGLYWTALILVLVGALNLGFLGLTGVNLLGVLFGGEEWLLRTIYILIGLAGAFFIYWSATVDRARDPVHAGPPRSRLA